MAPYGNCWNEVEIEDGSHFWVLYNPNGCEVIGRIKSNGDRGTFAFANREQALDYQKQAGVPNSFEPQFCVIDHGKIVVVWLQ